MRALLEQALTALVQCTYDEEGYLLNPDNEASIEAIRAELAKQESEPKRADENINLVDYE